MDQHIKKVYVPMTETAFYILPKMEKDKVIRFIREEDKRKIT